jgi:hypothetical protein
MHQQNAMTRKLFLPTARQTNWLLVIGFCCLGYAMYLRYLTVEYTQVALACDAGLNTWQCWARKWVIVLFNNLVFGWVALAAAALNLIRPSIVLFAIAVGAAAAGIVLYNVNLSALAVALLVLSLARPASESI